MTAAELLKKRLDALPESQREAMAAQVLEEWEALQWDLRMTTDAQTGKLAGLTKEPEEDHRAGQTRPMELAHRRGDLPLAR